MKCKWKWCLSGATGGHSWMAGWQVLFVPFILSPNCLVCRYFQPGCEHKGPILVMSEQWVQEGLWSWKPWAASTQLSLSTSQIYCRKQTSPLLLLVFAFMCNWTDIRLRHEVKPFESFVFDPKRPVKRCCDLCFYRWRNEGKDKQIAWLRLHTQK